jgi:adenosylcobinamide kinase/adenosylcobinamide-phosphate guanylyltransferase
LVLGGIRSGKSQWAERLVTDSVHAGDPVRYVATGPSDDTDGSWPARVAAHRQRRPAGWLTVETADVATVLRKDAATATLVDDVGGWLTAMLDRRDAWVTGSVCADTDELLSAISDFGAPLVMVSPEVGLAVVPATASGRRFTDELGALNQRLAGVCERVVLVVAGQPVMVKETDDDQ